MEAHPPRVVGYVALDGDNEIFVRRFKTREAAQAFVDRWAGDCDTAGVDANYRVAEIVEPSA